jgi:hypothetical protein
MKDSRDLSRFAGCAVLFALTLVCLSASSFSQERVTIRTSNGHYLTAVNGGGVGGPNSGSQLGAIHTDARAIGPWETFVCERRGPDRMTFRTNDGHFLTAVNGGGIGGPNDNPYQLHTDTTSVGPWEQFRIIYRGRDLCALQTSDGHYVSAVNRGGWGDQDSGNQFPIHTNATRVGPWEIFVITRQ